MSHVSCEITEKYKEKLIYVRIISLGKMITKK